MLILAKSGMDMENVYNADETGLYWKCTLTTTLATRNELNVKGMKGVKDRVTAMLCANASGSHKVPLLTIGKYQHPRCFKGKKLPVPYHYQSRAWMDTKVFLYWYDEIFIPSVKDHQRKSGRNGKVLLLLDNAPSHPLAETLDREDGAFTVMYLPPNVRAVIQPMDQTVIAAFKRI